MMPTIHSPRTIIVNNPNRSGNLEVENWGSFLLRPIAKNGVSKSIIKANVKRIFVISESIRAAVTTRNTEIEKPMIYIGSSPEK